MRIHELKCCTDDFVAIERGFKTAEFRPDDGFEVGDVLHLRAWDSDSQRYAEARPGRPIDLLRPVTHVVRSPNGAGVPEGFALLSLGRGFR